MKRKTFYPRALWGLVILALITTTPSTASADDAPKPSGAVVGLGELQGRWKLDRDASDSFEPVMKALEVSWLIRRIAGVGSVYLTLELVPSSQCDDCPVRVRVTEKTPLRTTDFEIVLDGVVRPGVDPAGNETQDQYSTRLLGEMVLERRRTLPSGRAMRLQDRRSIGGKPDVMESVLKVWIEDRLEATSKRVFVRVN